MSIGILISTIKNISINKRLKENGLDYESLHNLSTELYSKAYNADTEVRSAFFAAQALIVFEMKNKVLNIKK